LRDHAGLRHRGPAAVRGVPPARGRLRRAVGHTVNNTEKVAPLESPTEPAEPREQDFARHLRRAGELIGAQRLPEGELEILKALALSPRDLRALKLLALVRFKLGRLAEAREVYRTAHEVAPEDAAVRLNLGLIALKLDWFEEAISELES